MKKVRISCDVNWKLRKRLDAQAKEDGISRAKFIEIAVENKVEGFNVHKENKRLTEARRKAELEINTRHQKISTLEKEIAELKDSCDDLVSQKKQLTAKHADQIKEIATALGVPDTISHIKQRIAELNENHEQLEREKTERTEQRDEFERQLHAETDAYNKCYERAESLKKERNRFKAQAEEAQSKFETCEEKLTCLLTRNWWERLWNILPWVE
jgi:chromosome segregation ATPase